ncbi:unnamed protein product [Dibothriocephalus latus]|uniref:Ig-like domain-containing protein n=1 Tax=Dibothriocephalus latus TaxID=60516 RepID=A0A3P6T7R3_DIBLA|nr:unnamed protein product [Dibothriocephalus latus]
MSWQLSLLTLWTFPFLFPPWSTLADLDILSTDRASFNGVDMASLPDVESLRSLALPSALAEDVTAESFQSSVCSPTDERLQRQCFSELPADRYEVLEGANVRMRCRVNRQKGKTQWRAHSILLDPGSVGPGTGGCQVDLRNYFKY